MWDAYFGQRLYVDSNVLILAVEAGNRWTSMLADLFTAIDAGSLQAVTSELSLAETISKPIEVGAQQLVADFETLLSGNGPIEVFPVNRGLLRSAAALRGRLKVKLIDAIHVATAVAAVCDAFVSNDKRLGKKLDVPRWLPLGDVV